MADPENLATRQRSRHKLARQRWRYLDAEAASLNGHATPEEKPLLVTMDTVESRKSFMALVRPHSFREAHSTRRRPRLRQEHFMSRARIGCHYRVSAAIRGEQTEARDRALDERRGRLPRHRETEDSTSFEQTFRE